MTVTTILLIAGLVSLFTAIARGPIKLFGNEMPAVQSPKLRIVFGVLGVILLCVPFLSPIPVLKIVAHYTSQFTTKVGGVKPETESPAPNVPPQSPSPSSAPAPASPHPTHVASRPVATAKLKSASALPAHAPVHPVSATATQPPAPAPEAQPAAPEPPHCVTGQMVKDWTVDYDFQGSTSDTTGPAYPTSIYVSEDLDTNVRGNIRRTAIFKTEVNKLHEQAYLKEDEQKRVYDILKELKKLKPLSQQPAQSSFGQVTYQYKKESITYFRSDSAILWRYSFEGKNHDAGSGVSDRLSITDLSQDSQVALRKLDIKIELSVDDACNDGEAELSTSP